MKIEELAYAIAGNTLAVLAEKYHQVLPDDHQAELQGIVQSRVGAIQSGLRAADGARPRLEDLAYAIAGETLRILEERHHYRISDEHKRDIQRAVQGNLTDILSGPPTPRPEDSEGAERTDDAAGPAGEAT